MDYSYVILRMGMEQMKPNNCSTPEAASHQDCFNCSTICDCRRETPSQTSCAVMMVLAVTATFAWIYGIYEGLKWLYALAIK